MKQIIICVCLFFFSVSFSFAEDSNLIVKKRIQDSKQSIPQTKTAPRKLPVVENKETKQTPYIEYNKPLIGSQLKTEIPANAERSHFVGSMTELASDGSIAATSSLDLWYSLADGLAQGEAKISALGSFELEGERTERGFKLMLRNDDYWITLFSGLESEGELRGFYTIPFKNKKGPWQAKRR